MLSRGPEHESRQDPLCEVPVALQNADQDLLNFVRRIVHFDVVNSLQSVWRA